MKNNILILNSYYLPGFKGGGPVKSIKNIVDNLGEKYNFYILTSDRDLNDEVRYNNIEINKWIKKENYYICYIDTKKTNIKEYLEIMNSIQFKHIYMNGYFSPNFTIKPLLIRKLNKLDCKSIIICPRGDFSPGHLKIKGIKKYTYIVAAKIFRLYDNVLWQSTSEIETDHILKIYKNANISVVTNLPYSNRVDEKIVNKNKVKGNLKLVFISRIVSKKNLLYALKCLKEIKEGNIEFDIFGPKEDLNYWKECSLIIAGMSNNVKVNYRGELRQEDVINKLSKYHAFFFPTLGENYGHVIVEALLAGCVPILSDETPWRNLVEKKVGWDINLTYKNKFISAIKELSNMEQDDFNKYSNNAYQYIIKMINYDDIIDGYEKLFS